MSLRLHTKRALTGSLLFWAMACSAAGEYRIALFSTVEMEAAEAAVAALVEQGQPAYGESLRIKERTWFRVVLGGFASDADARAALPALRQQGYATPWVIAPVAVPP